MLREHLKSIQDLCLLQDAPQEILNTLGDQERWLVYRTAIRERFEEVMFSALPRTTAAWGKDKTLGAISHWLHATGPRSRLFREIPQEFANFVLQKQLLAGPAWLTDLLQFELAIWSAMHRLDFDGELTELSFSQPIAINPTCTLVRVDYPVHQKALNLDQTPPRCLHLAVVRRSDSQISTWELNEVAFVLMKAWQDCNKSLKAHIEDCARTHHWEVDTNFVENLSTMLADFVEREIVLGSIKALA